MPLATELVVVSTVAAVVAAAYHAPRDRPGDLSPGSPTAVQEPAAVGLVELADEPAPPGRFIVRRRPDGPGIRPSQPWAGLLVVGSAQVEVAGRWYAVVGPAPPGEVLGGETAVLAGDRPEGGPWPFRIAPEGGR